VLRGPQGTLFGANALAGLIYVKSAEPSDTFEGRAEVDVGNFNEHSFGAVLTGPIDALDSEFRLAVQRYNSDGFYYNGYLDRDNTDARDELTVRGRWRFQPSEEWRVDLTLLRLAMNNGYDAFDIANTRTTQSDQPGVDRQYSTGVALRSAYSGWSTATLTTIWTLRRLGDRLRLRRRLGNPLLWAPYTYDYTEYQSRHRSTTSLEFRLGNSPDHGFAWVVGSMLRSCAKVSSIPVSAHMSIPLTPPKTPRP